MKLFWAVLAFGVLSVQSVFAIDPIEKPFLSNKAVRGYDTVAYFTDNKAVEGQSKFKFTWQAADWYFSSAAHLELFKANPTRYAPQYGGYCAWAMSQGKLAGIDPKLFTIVDGQLYLNYNQKVQDQWLPEKEQLIISADQYWLKLMKK